MTRFSNLRRQLAFASILILMCSCTLGGLLMWGQYRTMVAAAADRAALMRFTDVATALIRIAAERGPTNTALTIRVPTENTMAALASSRMRSDDALRTLLQDPSIAAHAGALAARLGAARVRVDDVLRRSVEQRSPADIQACIQGMFDVIDHAQLLINSAMRPIEGGRPSTLMAFAHTIRMLSDLRDFAGRMGSAFIVPLSTGLPISPDQRLSYLLAHGRVLALEGLLENAVPLAGNGVLLPDYRVAIDRFNGEGLQLLQTVLVSAVDGAYTMDAATFTARIVPYFRGLEEVRDRFFQVAVAFLEADERSARYSFATVSAVSVFMVMLECALMIAAQRLIFRPLITAREVVLGMADGVPDTFEDAPRQWGEMRDLFGALQVLSARLRERIMFDEENTRLTEQLRCLADRDGLTGILNRGALDRLVTGMIGADDGPETLGLILLDIDHFKAINDSFGHSTGDCVLKIVAERVRAILPSDAIFARFGGEEFAAVLPAAPARSVLELAERMRHAIAPPIPLASGASVLVTASFGVARSRRGLKAWASLIDLADVALYRAKRGGRNRVMPSEALDTETAEMSAA